MRHPTTVDENGSLCLMVIKRGIATDLTIGRASDVRSYPCHCSNDGRNKTSEEWAIIPYDSQSGPFLVMGDLGSIVVDGQGRVGGVLTSGAGSKSSLDISYATPISFLLEHMQDIGLHDLDINPVLIIYVDRMHPGHGLALFVLLTVVQCTPVSNISSLYERVSLSPG